MQIFFHPTVPTGPGIIVTQSGSYYYAQIVGEPDSSEGAKTMHAAVGYLVEQNRERFELLLTMTASDPIDSEPRHSPGPWAVDAEARHPWIVTCPVNGMPEISAPICEVAYRPNALLIAAAPELLQICIDFCAKVDRGEARSTATYAAMKAVIAKATPQ